MSAAGPIVGKVGKATKAAKRSAKVAKRQQNVAKHMLDPDGPSKSFVDNVFDLEWPSGAPVYQDGGAVRRPNEYNLGELYRDAVLNDLPLDDEMVARGIQRADRRASVQKKLKTFRRNNMYPVMSQPLPDLSIEKPMYLGVDKDP